MSAAGGVAAAARAVGRDTAFPPEQARYKPEARATPGLTPARQPAQHRPLLVSGPSGRNDFFVIGGHRGSGENMLPNGSLPALRENTIASFQHAVQRGAKFLEFDVQVTQEGVPVIWHDIFIQTADAKGSVRRQLVCDTTLAQFKELVRQRAAAPTQLVRNFKMDSGAFNASPRAWHAAEEDELPTLAEVFAAIPEHVGFDIEIKTTTPSSWMRTPPAEVARLVDAVSATTLSQVGTRPLAFSSFDPDVCAALRAAQPATPVLFLSSGGIYFHCDPRRTSVEAAIAVAREGQLQGVVFDSAALLHHRHAVQLARRQGLSVMTYGLANNDASWVREQQALGVQAAIVDDVAGIVAATCVGIC